MEVKLRKASTAMVVGGTATRGFNDNDNNVKAILGKRTSKKTKASKTRMKTEVNTSPSSSLILLLTLDLF